VKGGKKLQKIRKEGEELRSQEEKKPPEKTTKPTRKRRWSRRVNTGNNWDEKKECPGNGRYRCLNYKERKKPGGKGWIWGDPSRRGLKGRESLVSKMGGGGFTHKQEPNSHGERSQLRK